MNIESPTSQFGCLDFRREKMADPKRLSPAAVLHQHECEACQRFAQRADKLESSISEVLAIPAPEGFNDRIILKVRRNKQPPWRMFALAASVVLTVMLGVTHLRQDDTATQLALTAAAHAADENEEIAAHPSLEASQFGLILSNFGGDMQAPVGQVDYIHFCPIEGFGMGWHIRYQTPQGKVTLLLVPGVTSGAETRSIEVEGRQVMVRRAGQGYYALITDSKAGLNAAEQDLRNKVRWKS